MAPWVAMKSWRENEDCFYANQSAKITWSSNIHAILFIIKKHSRSCLPASKQKLLKSCKRADKSINWTKWHHSPKTSILRKKKSSLSQSFTRNLVVVALTLIFRFFTSSFNHNLRPSHQYCHLTMRSPKIFLCFEIFWKF